MSATFVWGLKRSGIHLVVNWLYANLGGVEKGALPSAGLHAQLHDGFADAGAGVAFHNNCGRLHSRGFGLGDLTEADFALAAARHRAVLFGVEDCDLHLAPRAQVPGAAHVLVLRDPLNNLASRLAAAATRPALFPVGEAYVDLFAAYCAEALGTTDHLAPRTVISFNRFVEDRAYRDAIAAALGTANQDAITEVSDYGGGSSFTGTDEPIAAPSVLSRHEQHPVPPALLDLLLARPAIREACTTIFGYDLAEVISRA